MLPNLANKNSMTSEIWLSDSSEQCCKTCVSHGIFRRVWISVVDKRILGVSTSIVDLVGNRSRFFKNCNRSDRCCILSYQAGTNEYISGFRCLTLIFFRNIWNHIQGRFRHRFSAGWIPRAVDVVDQVWWKEREARELGGIFKEWLYWLK